jgi:hypothetical protein
MSRHCPFIIDILLKVEVGINCAGAGIIKESPAV